MTNNNNKKKTKAKSNPVSFNPSLTRPSPLNRVHAGRDIIVTTLSGASTFTASEYCINPRLSDLFPSASLSATRYDMYQFEELSFHYHPTTAVTTTPGVLFLAWEPNAARGPPDSVAQISAYESNIQGPIYSPNLTLRVPKNKLGGMRYTRSGPTGSDLNLYDTGKLIVATDAVTSGECGYIEVFYKIRFSNYHLEETSPVQNRIGELYRSGNWDFVSSVITPIPWNVITYDFCGGGIQLDPSGTFRLPTGVYHIVADVTFAIDPISAGQVFIEIYKNGAGLPQGSYSSVFIPSGTPGNWSLMTQATIGVHETDTLYISVLSGIASVGYQRLLTDTSRVTMTALS